MYFDTFQFSAWLRRPLPCPFSGLYFRSRFHYGDFQPDSLTWKDHVRHWQEHFHISQVLRHPQLKTLFCLDQFAVNYLNQSHNNAKAVYLPDPVQIYTDHEIKVEELKASLGIEPGRQVLLLFGALDRRKGIHQLLQAVLMLPASLGKKLCLLLVGPISAQDQPLVQAQINQISQLLPVQIVIHDQFVIDRDIQPFFQLSDAVLAPYQRHVGTSSILIRAAAAQKPVLSSNYGLMGEWTRHYQLGLTVDSAVPSEIAKGLTQVLEKPATELCDRHKMKLFAQQNAAERYANTIFQHVLD
jgi:glycosyltransferase involved in cell wall biosynthesis